MRDDIEVVINRLEQSVQRLAWALMEVEPADLAAAPSATEWSPLQILAHVKAYDDVLTARLAQALTQDIPTIHPIDGDAWSVFAGYTEAPLDQTLMAYQRHRHETIWQLRRLPDEAFERRVARASGEQSLLELLRGTAAHEEEHVTQLNDLLGLDDEEA